MTEHLPLPESTSGATVSPHGNSPALLPASSSKSHSGSSKSHSGSEATATLTSTDSSNIAARSGSRKHRTSADASQLSGPQGTHKSTQSSSSGSHGKNSRIASLFSSLLLSSPYSALLTKSILCLTSRHPLVDTETGCFELVCRSSNFEGLSGLTPPITPPSSPGCRLPDV